MSNGANYIHSQLKEQLKDYIRSQYFGKSPLLLSALDDLLDREGILYRKPFIESSPAYKTTPNGINKSALPEWMKTFFSQLAEAGLGVYNAPFIHQIKALENAYLGEDLFIATGTGSGKTECFMWPLIAKLAAEAREGRTWNTRGLRVIIMYPMNALVSDQLGRLRRLIGDTEDRFIDIFRMTCGQDVRRPQFGMYTGRTPYPGIEPKSSEDRKLEKTLRKLIIPEGERDSEFYRTLVAQGKIPAKKNLTAFLERLHNGDHVPDEDDAELITRFEMQQFCPDILITNYSMLEYMLLRPREAKIWADTSSWLKQNSSNRLLFVIDEAHMYRGSAGGEVALLIRRMFHKLGIDRDRVQFILTTASMPDADDDDRKKVMDFAHDLTSASESKTFCYLTGERENMADIPMISDIPLDKFSGCSVEHIEDESTRLDELNKFWEGIEGSPSPFISCNDAAAWMYDNISRYIPFHTMINRCRGKAVSLDELAAAIFPKADKDDALSAVSTMLAITPIAKSKNGSVLFPARMHMFFRGIKGVYTCTNENCPHSCSDGSLTLGKLFLSDGQLQCPECGSVVYELYNDRRCGALFFKGYVNQDEMGRTTYLWHYPGQFFNHRMKEIHLFIPSTTDEPLENNRTHPILPCYLNIKSGFINFIDDSDADKPGIRKLYYCTFTAHGRPDIYTFSKCPHCKQSLGQSQLTSFSTRGNQSFFSLIKAQFSVQPPVSGKTAQPDRFPNEGRKVLLFSDSRQRAARLARDMSETSEVAAARQLFVLAVDAMERSGREYSMNDIYDYFCLSAAKSHVHLFHDTSRIKFWNDSTDALNSYKRSKKRGRAYSPKLSLSNSPEQMKEYLLRAFGIGYNTLYDAACCWIEPLPDDMEDALDMLDDAGITVTDQEFLEVFNAWIMYVCEPVTALGHIISDDVRFKVRHFYGNYGLGRDWDFTNHIKGILGWKKKSDATPWVTTLQRIFLDDAQPENGRLYIDLSRVKPRFDMSHKWYICEKCSEVTPYMLRNHCPGCGADKIRPMTDDDLKSLDFWRNPIHEALDGAPFHVIDVEEHTAQLSHKDQRDDMWSVTEQYELRFQDIIQEDETPVDVLSSTTTMEVGIDIGSLVAVGLRNIPPMRENYQQRAGRAGRRGASLSTIVTFCEDGPHDSIYFRNPVPMLRGEPRRPWIDVHSEKLLQRHINMVVLQEYIVDIGSSLDIMPAQEFLNDFIDSFILYLYKTNFAMDIALLHASDTFNEDSFRKALADDLYALKKKLEEHPELFGVSESRESTDKKSILDALYEEGIIPTYSFPKNVVSTYIPDKNGKLQYQVERGLDMAIGEYAPGRAIVVDKKTYQIGGLYYPRSEWKSGHQTSPARSFLEDPNYLKDVLSCGVCGWFGLAEEEIKTCPFCGNKELIATRQMLRPWGFAPRNAEEIQEAQLTEEYTATQPPLYSTLPEADEMANIPGCKNIRLASRANQRIIMVNKGQDDDGFMVCKDCGAAFPGNDDSVLHDLKRPYKTSFPLKRCNHSNTVNVDLGYDFITDILVLEFSLDDNIINANRRDNPWLNRAAQSLAEAIRLTASQVLDVEFTELVTGYRLRQNINGSFIDIYLYDSLSSGAGYAISVADEIDTIFNNTRELLLNCDCESSCYKCLKHYRNQFVHGILDRNAALQLLIWGIHGKLAEPIDIDDQFKYISSLSDILMECGCELRCEKNKNIIIDSPKYTKNIVIYPSMWSEPHKAGTIYVSDALIRYSMPLAFSKIISDMQ